MNDYGQTDYQIDLFIEVEKEFDNLVNSGTYKTIFSKMTSENDFIIAFFPCTHFCDANELQYRLWIGGKKVAFDKKSCIRLIARNKERAKYFELYLKFCYICTKKGLRCIIENPASSGNKNYLVQFSPIEVAWYEKDRSLFGDKYKKPTNFFAINFEMKENFIMFCQSFGVKSIYKDAHGCKVRSEILDEYAENFYKRFLENKF